MATDRLWSFALRAIETWFRGVDSHAHILEILAPPPEGFAPKGPHKSAQGNALGPGDPPLRGKP